MKANKFHHGGLAQIHSPSGLVKVDKSGLVIEPQLVVKLHPAVPGFALHHESVMTAKAFGRSKPMPTRISDRNRVVFVANPLNGSSIVRIPPRVNNRTLLQSASNAFPAGTRGETSRGMVPKMLPLSA